MRGASAAIGIPEAAVPGPRSPATPLLCFGGELAKSAPTPWLVV
jgi:hypothetical protein